MKSFHFCILLLYYNWYKTHVDIWHIFDIIKHYEHYPLINTGVEEPWMENNLRIKRFETPWRTLQIHISISQYGSCSIDLSPIYHAGIPFRRTPWLLSSEVWLLPPTVSTDLSCVSTPCQHYCSVLNLYILVLPFGWTQTPIIWVHTKRHVLQFRDQIS